MQAAAIEDDGGLASEERGGIEDGDSGDVKDEKADCKSEEGKGCCDTTEDAVWSGGKSVKDGAADDVAILRLPGELIGEVVSFLSSEDSFTFATTSKMLNAAVIPAVRRLAARSAPLRAEISLARMVSLQDVELWAAEPVPVLLPLLSACTLLQSLSILFNKQEHFPLVHDALASLPQLRQLTLRNHLMDGALGYAIAACSKLSALSVTSHKIPGDDVAAFLLSLRLMPQLTSLETVVRNRGDFEALIAMFPSVPRLQRLRLLFGGWSSAFTAALVEHYHSSLVSVTLDSVFVSGTFLEAEEVRALCQLEQLQELILKGLAFAPGAHEAMPLLRSMQQLQTVVFDGIDANQETWTALFHVLPSLRITTLQLQFPTPHRGRASAVPMLRLCEALYDSSSLTEVRLFCPRMPADDGDDATVALAHAVAGCSIRRWTMAPPLGQEQLFLRSWLHAPAVAKAVEEFTLALAYRPGAALPVDRLFLSCLRSCPALKRAELKPACSAERLLWFTQTLQEKPLLPATLRLHVPRETKLAADTTAAAAACGLLL
eukprot:PLAT13871.1.p1 GENE.PLAT13871.1~~PLAT13871.1.p1  ORF type:complete len:546 (+),score=150.03 PLAT13871.1:33-1670(+)